MSAKRARGATATVETQIATAVCPKRWASAPIPLELRLTSGPFYPNSIRARVAAAIAARALRFKHDLHFFRALELFGHGKTHARRTVKGARNSGFPHGTWSKATVPTPQLAKLVVKRVGRRE